MKSPIGSPQFCELDVGKRVDTIAATLDTIAKLPDEHCALYLLRYQVGRMDYTMRTTPPDSCVSALRRFDSAVRRAFEIIIGKPTSEEQWVQACLPVRCRGMGMRSVQHIAPVAYYSSRAATWDRCEAIWPGFSGLLRDPVREAERVINESLNSEDAVPILPCGDGVPSQKSISDKGAAARALGLLQPAPPLEKARLIAYSAPMVGRWLSAKPSPNADMHMSGQEVSICTSLQLGIAVMNGGHLCRFCNSVTDSYGIHCGSCMAGGDVTLRHNKVRNLMYKYCCRGQMNPELEKAGILEEPGVFVDMARPADIFIPDFGEAGSSIRVALDVKVINALGNNHYLETLDGPMVAAENYRETASLRDDVRARCAARGVRYEPLVFTTQGGCDKRTEALLSQIADVVARSECRESGAVKAEMLQAISMSIMKSVAKSIIRRSSQWRRDAVDEEGTEPMDEEPVDEDPMDEAHG